MHIRQPLTIAVPKGRILSELQPLMQATGIYPEEAFFDEDSRQLQFSCKGAPINLIRVRSFDVPTFVAFGGAHVGVAGSDVLMEFDYNDLYQPLDLNIGLCRLSIAVLEKNAAAIRRNAESHVRVATKYPNITRNYFAARGMQAECIKLNGAMELAPSLGLAPRIVDLVSSGKTLAANGLIETDVITQVSSRLIINRAIFKTRSDEMSDLIAAFREAVNGA
jgi:ATP phosphoribosyltransferase